MKIGFFTACLPHVPLENLAPWVAEQGFETLELAAWPDDGRRNYQARHVGAEAFTRDDAARVRDLMAEHGLSISALAYYDNNLHPDRRQRAHFHEHLRRVIDAAELLGVELVGTFVGGRPVLPGTNMREIGEVFREMVRYAEDHGVRLMIENCPMENWARFGLPGNYAYSPELWDRLFNEVPSERFGLNFDPSHLYWLGIDHEQAAREYADRIFHAHAKDAEILPEGRYRHGILSEQLGANRWRSGWWRYRMPGKGAIDWGSFIDTLREIGYDGALSIEHEDPEYEGSEEAVRQGLRLGLEHLQQCRMNGAR